MKRRGNVIPTPSPERVEVLPVLDLGETLGVVPFVPGQTIEGCECRRAGRKMVLRTGEPPAQINGLPVEGHTVHVMDRVTTVQIGGLKGNLRLQPVVVVGQKPPKPELAV